MPNAIEKAMLVLRMLSDVGGTPVTLAAMAERLEINKSTLAHIVKTLAEGGYVQRISHSEGYTLGPELYYLARQRYGEDL
ncbi:MAG: helix-turn-helix domain-containing protein, partial [Clostridia bacterium]|nr:helix-turn-helix domain-containing protein [Clostridia bacterium]